MTVATGASVLRREHYGWRMELVQLKVRRSQTEKKGMLGGSKGFQFSLSYQLVLTPSEKEIVDRYKLQDYAITFKSVQGTQYPDDTIASLIQGTTETVDSVETLLRNEDIIKSACDKLPVLFQVISTFGGEETIDYPREG